MSSRASRSPTTVDFQSTIPEPLGSPPRLVERGESNGPPASYDSARLELGRIVAIPQVGAPHRRYERSFASMSAGASSSACQPTTFSTTPILRFRMETSRRPTALAGSPAPSGPTMRLGRGDQPRPGREQSFRAMTSCLRLPFPKPKLLEQHRGQSGKRVGVGGYFLEPRFRGVWHLARQFYVSATYPARWTSFTPAPSEPTAFRVSDITGQSVPIFRVW